VKRNHKSLGKIGQYLFISILIFVGLCCTKYPIKFEKNEIPDEKTAALAVARIDSVLGFTYTWEFGRDKLSPLPKMKVKLSGKVEVPNKIYLKGTLESGDISEKLNVYSMEEKDYCYNKGKKKWESKEKGEYPNPYEQLKLILSFGNFEFVKFDKIDGVASYLFSFKPNVYLLDPIEATKPKGLIWVSIDSELPLRVKVESERRLIHWEMKLSHFNTFANLNVPFSSHKLEIVGIDCKAYDLGNIKKRLFFFDFENHNEEKESNGNVILFVQALSITDSLIKEIVKKGELEVYLGEWPRDAIYLLKQDTLLVQQKYGKDAKLFFERGIETKPIIALNKIFSNQMFGSFLLKNDMLGKASIYAEVKKDNADSLAKIVEAKKDEPAVIIIDGEAVLITRVRDSWIVENRITVTKGLNKYETMFLFSRLKFGPLAKNYMFKLNKKEE